jgi:hypothetical protein
MRETFKRAAILSILLVASCAYTPIDVSELQLTARDGGAVYYAGLRRDSPAVISITAEIDRRTYTGKLELTDANATFGLHQLYGPRDAAPAPAAALARTNFMKAILSSTDNRVLTCDFTDVGGRNAAGLCVDDTKRLYDVIFTGPPLLNPA